MTPVPPQYAIFPVINATLNGTSALLLVTAHRQIKLGRMAAHRALMLTAALTSSLFLASYLYYHWHVGSVQCRIGAFPKAGVVEVDIPQHSDFTYHSGDHDCTAGHHYVEPRAARAL